MSCRTTLFLMISALALAGCVSSGGSVSTGSQSGAPAQLSDAPSNAQQLAATSPRPTTASTANAPSTTPASSSPPTASAGTSGSSPGNASFVGSAASLDGTEYRLSPSDVIQISVFQVPDLTKTVEINAQGDIVLPLIGTVVAAGRTTGELEKEIAAKLAKDYIQSPQVSVVVTEYRSQKVTVDGAVSRPGVYPVPGGASLVQVLAMAGGLQRVADPEHVVIYRNHDGKRMSAVFDVDAIRDGKVDDPIVRGGDTVVVDDSQSRVAWRNVRESIGVAGFVTSFIP